MDDVRLVQTCYPQIYLACHTRHVRAQSSPKRLSTHDSALLSHLDEETPMSPSTLAKHLSIGLPTLSAALGRLVKLGYINRSVSNADRRQVELRLSLSGARAMQASSVLDTRRVEKILARLRPAERQSVRDGLLALARASREELTKPRRRIRRRANPGAST
jgi:DNA-binding MarR family transcriptional regulator